MGRDAQGDGRPAGFFADAPEADACTVVAAFRITSLTTVGLDSIGTWLLSTSTVVAPIRLAASRCSAGGTVRSFLAMTYQLGFVFQAAPLIFWVNRSGTGTPCPA